LDPEAKSKSIESGSKTQLALDPDVGPKRLGPDK